MELPVLLFWNRISASDRSYKDLFPPIFAALKLKMPTHLVGLLQKIKRRVANAMKTNNILCLIEEFPGLSMSSDPIVGPQCKENGILPNSLLEGIYPNFVEHFCKKLNNKLKLIRKREEKDTLSNLYSSFISFLDTGASCDVNLPMTNLV